MNINSTELLLLNKKIRFAGEEGKPAQEAVVPAPETNSPQTGMNMLMFQMLVWYLAAEDIQEQLDV